MNKTIISLLLISGLAFADAPAPYPVTVNSRAASVAPLEVYRANQYKIRASFVDGSTASAIPSNSVPFCAWFTNNTASALVTASYEVVSGSTGIVDFTFSPADLNYAPGRYGYEIGVKDSDGVPSVYRQGVFVISGSPIGTGATPTTWTSNIVWSLYSYAGTATAGPVRPDNTTISAVTNADGSITISAMASAVTWTNITDKPFTNLTDLTTNNLEGIAWGEFYPASNPDGFISSFTELDPVWGSESNLYYLASNPDSFISDYTETDPIWGAVSNTVTAGAALGATALQSNNVTSVAGRMGDVVITSSDLADFQTAVSANTLVAGAVQDEVDPIFTNWLAVTAQVLNWDTAYGWGDHSTNGYLTAETDPVWGAVSNLYYLASNPSNFVDASIVDGYVPTNRTITVNGDTQALDGDVSFTVAEGISASTASNIAQDAYSPAYVLAPASGTATVTRTVSGTYYREFTTILASQTVLHIDTSTFPTNGGSIFAWSVNPNGQVISVNPASIDTNSWNALTLTTNAYNDLIFRKAPYATVFKVQGE
jgi:hypothetical protein